MPSFSPASNLRMVILCRTAISRRSIPFISTFVYVDKEGFLPDRVTTEGTLPDRQRQGGPYSLGLQHSTLGPFISSFLLMKNAPSLTNNTFVFAGNIQKEFSLHLVLRLR
jgi:hypothetical protein